MHNLDLQILGPSSFVSTLNELKKFLKFKPLSESTNRKPNIILFHAEILLDKKQKNYIDENNFIKICVGKREELSGEYDASIELPAYLNEINTIIENAVIKKKFYLNSSIIVKKYLLNKNEKKLFRSNDHIILTEKEIQLIELFLNNSKPISKDKILSSVWNYSTNADTHTVETHIYRLRKKIADKFMDQKFILNNKQGYYL